MTPKAKKPETWRHALERRIATVRKTAEKRVNEGWERAMELLPPEPRKAVKRLTATVERTRHDLRKRAEKRVTEARKRAEKAVGTVRKRAEGLVEEVHERAEKVVTPLVRRLDVASRADIERLRKRLEHVERRLETKPHHETTAAA